MTMDPKALRLKDLTDQCERMRALIVKSFGVLGTIGMVRRAAGEVTLTNNGLDLLLSARFQNPMIRFVVGAVNDFHNRAGDGSKQFVLLLSEILRLLTGACNMTTKPIELSRAVDGIRATVLPDAVKNICSKMEGRFDATSVLERLIEGFLGGQFSARVRSALRNLILELYEKVRGSESGNALALDDVVEHFEFLCLSAEGRTVHASVVGNGFLVAFDGNFDRLELLNAPGPMNFTMLKRSEGDSENETILTSNEEDVRLAIQWTFENLRSRIVQYKDKGVRMILTSQQFPPLARSLLSQHEIILVGVIDEDDLERLATLVGKMSTSLYDPLVELNVAEATEVEIVNVGSRRYLRIVPRSRSNPVHVIVYGPTLGIGKQYKSAIFNCFKMIRTCSDPIQYYPSSLSPTAKTTTTSNCEERHLRVIPVGGLWEFLCCHEIQDYCNSSRADDDAKEFAKILSLALLAIPRTVHANSFLHDRIIPFVSLSHTALVSIENNNMLLCIDGRSGNLINARDVYGLESIHGKALLLEAVLTTLAQLLRVDFIICKKQSD